MKKRFQLTTLILGFMVACSSCTDNTRTKRLGGTEEITLKPNEVVLSVTWKGDQMWICTRDTTTNITYFREKSKWGILEGTVILH